MVREKRRGTGVVELGDAVFQGAGDNASRRSSGRCRPRRRRLRPSLSAQYAITLTHMMVNEVDDGGDGR